VRIEPKSLVKRLTPTATKLLEAAVGRAANGQCYEIIVEHLLLAMLEQDSGDAERLLRHFDQNPSTLKARVERVLSRQRAGNPGRPVFSESLFQWFEETWLFASLTYDHSRIESGTLLAQLALRPGRYTAESYPELESIPQDRLQKELEQAIAGSTESIESAPQVGGVPTPSKAGSPESEALKRFCNNFTEKARQGKIDPIFGRHREIRQLVDILARRRKNNPIIVGEPGVGKSALVEGLALAVVNKEVPEVLQGIELLELDLGLLQAGAGVKGEFENRLKAVISDVKASKTPIVLFIDEAHTLIGAGASAGGGDAANLLKPALARGELRTVAATTWAEYKRYFEKDAALERRFQPVKVDQPSVEEAVVMLRGLRPVYEKAHGVTILDEGVQAAAELSHRYISGRQLPDKAVDLLDTAAARVTIATHARPELMVALENDLAALAREKGALERDFSQGYPIPDGGLAENASKTEKASAALATLKAKWDGEKAALEVLKAAQKALSEAKEGTDKKPLEAAVSEASSAVSKARGDEPLVPSVVDRHVVSSVVAGWTGIPVGRMKSDAISKVMSLRDRLEERVIGQPAATRTVAEVIRISTAGIRNPITPVGVLLFVGPSGVGKTETALALADLLYGGERFLTTINMSEFQEKHSVSRLIGSPPGYVGYGQGGLLTEAVRQRPYSVVLLDEVEKADLEVMNLFYQVFDKGTLSDSEGRVVDFRNTIVILTSNLATDAIMRLHDADEPPTAEEVAEKIRPELSKHFKPALLARMSIVPFAPISPPVMRRITELKVKSLLKRLEESHKMVPVLEDGLLDALAKRATVAEVGARNVDHVLRGSLMPALSSRLLEEMAAGRSPKKVNLGLSPSGEWRIEFEG
jgi:type VI secretion system protein VasG